MNPRSPFLPSSILKSRAFLRRPSKRAALALALALLWANQQAGAADTQDNILANASNLGTVTTATYTTVPTTTSDITFAAATTYANAGSFTLTGTNPNPGSLDDLNATAISITGTTQLTLNAGTGSSNVVSTAGTNGGSGTDVLFVANGASLTLNDSGGILLTTKASSFDAVGTGVLNLGTTGVNIIAAQTLSFLGSGAITVGGAIAATTGAVTINDAGGSTTFSGANLYTGATTITAGTFNLNTGGSLAGATAITQTGGAFNLNGTSTISGGGAIAVSGGALAEAGGAIISGASTLTTTGGTARLSGLNTYTGATSVNGGTLNLDFSAATAPATAANIIKSGNTVNLGGGTLAVTGGGTGTNSQTFGTTALTANTRSAITANLNGGTALTLALGGITRNSQSAVDITFGGANVTTTSTGGTGGLLGDSNNVAYATANGGTTFVAKGGTTPFTLSALPTASYTNTYATGNNVDVVNGDTQTGVTVNTLRFNTASDALTLSGTNILNSAAILVTPTGTGSSITGGTITSTTGAAEVIIHDYSTFNEGAVIANANAGAAATKLTLTGTGTTTLSAANTMTGQTTLSGGTLNLSNSLALQNSPLQYNTGTTLVFDQSVAGNAFTLGGLVSSTNIALLNNATTPAPIALTLNVATGGSYTYSGVLSGSGASLLKTGAGSQFLTAANTYTGATTINGGILYLGGAGTGTLLNTSGVTANAGASLGFSYGNSGKSESTAISGVLSGAGGLTDSQGNQNAYLTLDRANTYTGPTTMTARGALQSNVAAAYDANGNMISSGFGVNSALVLGGLGTNAGVTAVLGSNSQLGSLSTNGATVSASAGNGIILNGFNLITGGDNTSTTFNSQITGAALPNGGTTTGTRSVGGNLTKIGTGTQTLGGSNLYEGVTAITGGTLAVTTLANGGIATTGTVASGSNQLTVANAAGLSVGQIIQSSVLAGTAETITAINGNVLTLSGNASAALTNGPVFGGTGNGLGISTNAASNLVLDGGTLQYTGAATSTDRLFTVGSTAAGGATGTLDASGTGAVNFTNTGAIAYGTTGQARTLGLMGANTGANTLAPSIADNGAGAVSLTKAGAGSWTLTGNNTYTGTTTVSGGILTATGAGTNKALGGTTGIAVNNGGTLLMGAANQASAAAAVTLGTTAAQTPASTTGVLSFAAGASQGAAETLTGGTAAGGPTTAGLGALTLNNTSTLAFNGTGTTLVFGTFTPNGNVLTITGYTNSGTMTAGNSGTAGDDRLIFSGDQTGNFADFNFGAGAGAGVGEIALDGGFYELSFTAVPEPSTWVGGVLLLSAMAWQYRRQSRRTVS